MEKVKNVPRLRFPEFDGEWKEKKIEEIFAEFKSGQGITSRNISDIGEYPVYGGNGLRGFTKTYTHEGFYFLIGRQGALCGNINKVKGKVFISEHAIACKANENSDTEFLAQRLDYYNLNKLSESSAQPGLAVNKLLKLNLIIPTLPEQTKIANFLTLVDERLSLLKKKRSKLEAYKSGVMQRLFSQELRFKDENGMDYPDWEEKRLGEVGEFIGGGTPSTKNEDYWNGEIPWISSSDIIESSINKINISRYITEEAINKSATKLIPAKSILIVSRVGVGKVAINITPICTSQDFTSLIPKNDNYIFLAYLIKVKTNWLLSFNQGTSIKGFVKSDLELLEIELPCYSEQTKIANFLTTIDGKLGQLDREIEKAENWKKGMLQGMFC